MVELKGPKAGLLHVWRGPTFVDLPQLPCSNLDGGILALQPFGKGVQIRNAAAQTCIKPGVKLLLSTTPHHRDKPLRQEENEPHPFKMFLIVCKMLGQRED